MATELDKLTSRLAAILNEDVPDDAIVDEISIRHDLMRLNAHEPIPYAQLAKVSDEQLLRRFAAATMIGVAAGILDEHGTESIH